MKSIFFSFVFFCFQLFAGDYTREDCPVVGNTESKIYHVRGGLSYEKMLRKNRTGDNRQCFKSEKEALDAGYRKAKR